MTEMSQRKKQLYIRVVSLTATANVLSAVIQGPRENLRSFQWWSIHYSSVCSVLLTTNGHFLSIPDHFRANQKCTFQSLPMTLQVLSRFRRSIRAVLSRSGRLISAGLTSCPRTDRTAPWSSSPGRRTCLERFMWRNKAGLSSAAGVWLNTSRDLRRIVSKHLAKLSPQRPNASRHTPATRSSWGQQWTCSCRPRSTSQTATTRTAYVRACEASCWNIALRGARLRIDCIKSFQKTTFCRAFRVNCWLRYVLWFCVNVLSHHVSNNRF